MTQADLTHALADCLARLEAGEPLDRTLARHPALRPELDGLVAAAGSVRALPARSARPAFRATLAAELARLEAVPPPTPAGTAGGAWPVLLLAGLLAGLVGLVAVAPRAQQRRAAALVAGDPRAPAAVGMPGVGAPAVEIASTQVLRHVGPATARPVVTRPTGAPTLPAAAPRHTTLSVWAPAMVAGAGPVVPTPPPSATPSVAPPTEAPDEPTAEPVPSNTTAAPGVSPEATPTATPTHGPVRSASVSGTAQQGDMPLAGLTVELYAHDQLLGCDPDPVVVPAAVATTDAAGRFELPGLPAGWYRLAARGGRLLCLPRRWHTGENSPAAPDPCGALAFGLVDGQAAASINVLFELGLGGCP